MTAWPFEEPSCGRYLPAVIAQQRRAAVLDDVIRDLYRTRLTFRSAVRQKHAHQIVMELRINGWRNVINDLFAAAMQRDEQR